MSLFTPTLSGYVDALFCVGVGVLWSNTTQHNTTQHNTCCKLLLLCSFKKMTGNQTWSDIGQFSSSTMDDHQTAVCENNVFRFRFWVILEPPHNPSNTLQVTKEAPSRAEKPFFFFLWFIFAFYRVRDTGGLIFHPAQLTFHTDACDVC